jgi:hypothetical protein
MNTLVALFCLVTVGMASAEELIIRHPATGDPEGRNEYQVEVLRAVLTSTLDSHGPFRLEPVPDMPQAREIQSLVSGKWHDVLWTVTSAKREAIMSPIRFPLLRGLLGHRICLIRYDDPLFKTAKSPDRGKLVIGQAVTWPDTPIFEANELITEAGSSYQSTLRMLLARRTNCFPRGLSEIDIELAAFASSELAVEPQLSFLYFAPMYFFVAPDRTELAERVELGFQRIRDSGEFLAIFSRHFDTDGLFDRYRMADRTPFCLDNPNLTPSMLSEMKPNMISGPGTFADTCLPQTNE